jgi:hypothetical protein
MIYVVFECDAHRMYESYCVKEMFTNKRKAISFFNKCKKIYTEGDDGWILNLAVHTPTYDLKCQSDVLHDLEIIKHTEQ